MWVLTYAGQQINERKFHKQTMRRTERGKKRERERKEERMEKSGLLSNEVNENKLASGFSFFITVRLNWSLQKRERERERERELSLIHI